MYLSYLQRLGSINLEPVEIKRMTNDLVFMYKYFNGFIYTNLPTCIQPTHNVNLRDICKKLRKMPYRLILLVISLNIAL